MTAVEFIVEQLAKNGVLHSSDIAKAKELEKEQIKDAFDECGMWQDNYSDSEHYYKQTFKSE
jgi:hypothetical protein